MMIFYSPLIAPWFPVSSEIDVVAIVRAVHREINRKLRGCDEIVGGATQSQGLKVWRSRSVNQVFVAINARGYVFR
jgi:hypothetical protein